MSPRNPPSPQSRESFDEQTRDALERLEQLADVTDSVDGVGDLLASFADALEGDSSRRDGSRRETRTGEDLLAGRGGSIFDGSADRAERRESLASTGDSVRTTDERTAGRRSSRSSGRDSGGSGSEDDRVADGVVDAQQREREVRDDRALEAMNVEDLREADRRGLSPAEYVETLGVKVHGGSDGDDLRRRVRRAKASESEGETGRGGRR